MIKTYISHHGIKGQKWGIRRYQNDDGTLTPAGARRYQRLDDRWVRRKADKIHNKALKESKPEMKQYVKELKKTNPQAGKRTIFNLYNKRLAQVMRSKTKDIESPSGKVIEWVAKRGQVGVHMALADRGYDMNNLRNGVWGDGRVAYRKNKLAMQDKEKGGM